MASPTTSTTDLTRRERRKLEVHNRILEAAVALFEERGPRETTVVEICERADVAHKTFFNHFPTKLDLLREIAHAGIEQLMFEIEEIRKADIGTPERIARFFDTVASQITDAPMTLNSEIATSILPVRLAHSSRRSSPRGSGSRRTLAMVVIHQRRLRL